MKKIMYLASCITLLFLFSCGGKKLLQNVLPIETETKTGEVVIATELPKTAERDDIPVGWKPSDVAAKITTESGAKIYIPKDKPFAKKKKPVMNKQAVEDIKSGKLKAEVPKKSYAWLYWLIGVPALLIFINYALVLSIGFNPIAWLGERIFKRKK